MIHIDGAARGNPGEAGIGVLIEEENGGSREVKKYLGTRTNNQAEYSALITALESSRDYKNREIRIFTDSLLLANQMNGFWKVKHPEIKELYSKAKGLIEGFSRVTIKHIPREENTEADRLANLAIDEYL
ncbi:MAG TPA: ribonuclease HI family protein [Thermodesulfobacteriota bacterium]|nr:ribonuclease HI family protein [Thermodesulfobacteriota bacterium]